MGEGRRPRLGATVSAVHRLDVGKFDATEAGVNGRDVGITHFTSLASAVAILEGWRRDLVEGERHPADQRNETVGPQEIKLRLYSRWGTNDPLEQNIANGETEIASAKHRRDGNTQFRNVFPDTTYMMCGSKPQGGSDGETIDRLELWRAYGDDGKGVAFTTWWNEEQLSREGLEIVEVDYLSKPELDENRKKIERLYGDQKEENKSRAEREKHRRARMQLEAGCKHNDYKAEQEVRLVCYLGDESGAMRRPGNKEIHLEAAKGRLRTYIERPVRLGVTLTGLDITLGPRILPADVGHWIRMGRWMLSQFELSGGKVRRSELGYIG